MIKLRGPLGEQLDGAPSDARTARVEQAVAERRRRDGARGTWRLVLVPAASAAIAAALVTAWALRAPEPAQTPAGASADGARRASGAVVAREDEARSRDEATPPGTIAPTQQGVDVRGVDASAGLAARDVRGVDDGSAGGLARADAKALRARDTRLVARASKAEVPVIEAIERALTEADAARARGANDEAVAILVELAERHAGDPRASVAAFTAARIQQDVLGDARGALRSLETALRLGLADELREPARARRIDAWLALDDVRAARIAALDYLAHHPDGASAERARRLERGDAR